MPETEKELIAKVSSLLKKSGTRGSYGGVAERQSATYNEAAVLMLLALYKQNETIIQQNSDIRTALQRIIDLG